MIIFGCGNHARDLEAIALRCGIDNIAFYDDVPKPGISKPPLRLSGPAVIGVNDPSLRKQIFQRLRVIGTQPLVDPSAVLGTNIRLGLGVVVAPLASLLVDVVLGDHVHINYHVSMTRCKVATFSTISPGATICGNVEIGECTTIGAGAIICERTTIGNDVIVGAGAIVPPYSTVPDGAKVIGVWKG